MPGAAITFSLEELAAQLPDCTVRGAGKTRIEGVCSLSQGRTGCIAFADSEAVADALKSSTASAVIVDRRLSALWPGPCLVAPHPKLVFARVARLFEVDDRPTGIHATAVIAPSARVAANARIGAHVVVGEDTIISDGASIAAAAIIGAGVTIGHNCRIGARVVIERASVLGDRVTIEAGAVIGARGFGLVEGPTGLEAIPQLGRVVIGNDVEIGANTTIDRAALDETRIGNGVKIDNQVHIGHNCTIGDHTVIAGCTGIAGSCTIGAGCMIGGGVGIGDHLTIADQVIITAASQVPKDILEAGVYSSTFRAMPAPVWRRRLALFRALDRIDNRLRRLERTSADKGEH